MQPSDVLSIFLPWAVIVTKPVLAFAKYTVLNSVLTFDAMLSQLIPAFVVLYIFEY